MNARRPPSDLLRRLVTVALLVAGWVLLASVLLGGFVLRGAAASAGVALTTGAACALAWPALARSRLPLSAGTLALGTLAAAAAVLALAAAVLDPVELDLLAGALTVLGATAVATVAGGLLALDRGDLWDAHVIERQLRHTLPVGEPDAHGLLLLEVDGLAHDVLRRALRNGDAPALACWLHGGTHRLVRYETGWSSQTGACQAGLLHGDDHDWPAFRWWEKDRGRAIVTNNPRDAAELERRRSNGRGLLFADGASRANILSGDAPHSMLTMSTVLDLDRPGALGEDYLSYFRSPLGVLRTILRGVGELAVERHGARQQRRRDVRPRIDRHWSYAFLRAYATVLQLDLQVAAVTADVLAGRPVIYTTFLAYDEVAHHSGVERADALAILRRVDRAIARIAEAVERAERPYHVVVLSDHGQSQGATFRQRYGEGLEDIVARHSGPGRMEVAVDEDDEARTSLRAAVSELAAQPTATGRTVRRVAPSQRAERRAQRAGRVGPASAAPEPPPEVSVMASGNLGVISFPRDPGRVTLEQIEQHRPGLIAELRTHPGVGFVLVRSAADGAVVLGPRGRRLLGTGAVEGEDPLAGYGPHAADVVRRTDAFPHCPDILVNGTYWEDSDEVAAFEELVGSHGGLGGAQSQPFVLFPAGLPWPKEPVVGAPAVHRILRDWLVRSGQRAYELEPAREEEVMSA